MYNAIEFQFLRDVLQKCRLKVEFIDPTQPPELAAEKELLRQLGWDEAYDAILRELLTRLEPETIYKLTDRLMCSYFYLCLGEKGRQSVLAIGPYLTFEPTRELLMEHAERAGIQPGRFRLVEQFYAGIPVVMSTSPIFTMLDTFCDRIWGKNYASVDLNRETAEAVHPFPVGDLAAESVDTELTMRMMEQRYAYENELMQAVSKGQSHKVELIMNSFSRIAFERRVADPVRNMKNYCIIMNTILRKAAEEGGVHPLYLDRVSSDFARRIEAVNAIPAVERLMPEMYRAYCRLVKKNSIKRYSPPVQRAIVQIDSDLSGDLSLKHLAEVQNINASYLSTLFKRETGQTITDFVIGRRIQLARQLLATTKLQIQTIARYCGIPDVNYFSKIFKKHNGLTPKEYRREVTSLNGGND